jgi:hypothetical protein
MEASTASKCMPSSYSCATSSDTAVCRSGNQQGEHEWAGSHPSYGRVAKGNLHVSFACIKDQIRAVALNMHRPARAQQDAREK